MFASKRVAAIEEALGTLQGQVTQLESDRRSHLAELDEMYEKIGRLYGRIRKRQERATQDEDEPELPDTPCQDPITAKLHAFREARTHVLGQS